MPSTYLVSTGTPLSLGSVTFYDVEHPDELPLDFKQLTVVHELIGGGRVIQSLGIQPQEFRWSGYLFEDAVETRVKELAGLCAAGYSIPFTFAQYKFDVIITEFKPTFYSVNYAKYEIAVQIVADNSGLFTQAAIPSVDKQTNQLLTNANVHAWDLAKVDPVFVPDSINTADIQIKIQGVQSIASASQSQLAPILTEVQNAATLMNNYLTPLLALSGSQATYSVFQKISKAQKILNALNLVASNLQNGQSVVTVQAIGADLMQLASLYYGDPSLYTVIKEANNLTSFRLPSGSMTTLKIPPVPSSSKSN